MTLFNQTIINRTNQKTKMFFYSPVQVSDERRKDITTTQKNIKKCGKSYEWKETNKGRDKMKSSTLTR